MATKYTMNFTDLSKSPFFIRSYTTNGPINPNSTSLPTTSSAAATSLLLHGKGMDNYGERIQENLVHMLENFASHVPPVFPINGQIWLETVGSPAYELRVYNSNTGVWDYLFKTNDQGNFDAGGRKIVNLGSPSDPGDAVNLASFNLASMSDTTITAPVSEDILMYSGGVWINRPVGSPILATAGGTMSGFLTLHADPLLPFHAATKNYVDSGGVTTLGGLSDVNITSVPVTGSPLPTTKSILFYDPLAHPTNWQDKTFPNFVTDEGIITTNGTGTDNKINTGLQLPVVFTGSPTPTLPDYPAADEDATTKKYVDLQDGATLAAANAHTDAQVASGGSVVTSGIYEESNPDIPTITLAQSSTGSPPLPDVVIFMDGVKDSTSDLVTHEVGDPNTPDTPTDVDLSEFSGGLAFEEMFNSQFFPSTVSIERIFAELNLALGEFVAPKRHLTFTSSAGGTIYLGDTSAGALTDQMNPTGNLEPEGVFPHVGHHALTVFVDGVKQYVSESGYRRVEGNFTGSPSHKFNLTNRIQTGLALGGSPSAFTFQINVNGAGNVTVAIPGVASMEEVVDEINTVADINYWVGSPQNASYQFGCDLIDGDLIFYSGNPGTGSTIALTDINLFSSLIGGSPTGLFTLTIGNAIAANYAPVDRDYVEVGRWGEPTDQIQFVGSPVIGSVVELTLDQKLFGA